MLSGVARSPRESPEPSVNCTSSGMIPMLWRNWVAKASASSIGNRSGFFPGRHAQHQLRVQIHAQLVGDAHVLQ